MKGQTWGELAANSIWPPAKEGVRVETLASLQKLRTCPTGSVQRPKAFEAVASTSAQGPLRWAGVCSRSNLSALLAIESANTVDARRYHD